MGIGMTKTYYEGQARELWESLIRNGSTIDRADEALLAWWERFAVGVEKPEWLKITQDKQFARMMIE